MPADIVVVGSANMDLVVRAPRVPERGETLSGTDFRTFPGGKGANQAVAAARQGGRVAMVGCVGADPFGGQLREALRRDGVDLGAMGIDPDLPTGVALIAVEDGGDNRIIVVAGANAQVTPARVEAAADLFTPGGVLIMQLEIPLPTVRRAAVLAHERGMQVILNAAPAQRLDRDLLALVDYLVVNEIEAAMLAGLPPDGGHAAAGTLREWGVRHVVITLGAEGAVLFDATGRLAVPGFRVPVVDTTAAGDAFAGAFAVALLAGLPPPVALRRANAAGALAVTHPGAQPSLPTRAETDAFLAGQGGQMRDRAKAEE